ncbi:class II aldolase/adducin family protein [Pelagibacteraceae bacterium]|nr:class II aldolase/adducin family protein [Pelagibacteraceae bacterium]MDC0365818.1 class II aldolase/adducin family protein [Pelagibacteraceae bacterium]
MSKLKAEVIKYSKKLNITNLSALRSGNISVRAKEKGIDGFYITPSGMKYSTLKIKDIVFVSLKGIFDKKKSKPSSEWRFHQDIYVNKKEAKAIVHAHSTCATAVSSHQKNIPAFHYMVAVAGGEDLKCTKYATFGTKELSRNILKALKNRSACLIANHGQVAFGNSLEKTFELAQEIENICHQYINALRIGIPKILSKKEMKIVLGKFKNYKKG